MKLALYLPNFRDSVTVKELEDLTELAEDLDFDSVWTLDRIVVPEASDREELVHSFGMMDGFPKQLPSVRSRPVVSGLAAHPVARGEDVEGTHRHEHHRHAVPSPRRPCGRARHGGPSLQRQAECRRRGRLDARGVRSGQCIAHLPEAAQARAGDDRDHAGHLDERAFRVPRRVRRLRLVWFRGKADTGPAPADLHERAEGSEAISRSHRQVQPVRLDRDSGPAGSDVLDAAELARLDTTRAQRAPTRFDPPTEIARTYLHEAASCARSSSRRRWADPTPPQASTIESRPRLRPCQCWWRVAHPRRAMHLRGTKDAQSGGDRLLRWTLVSRSDQALGNVGRGRRLQIPGGAGHPRRRSSTTAEPAHCDGQMGPTGSS